jgi:hypothetical protein
MNPLRHRHPMHQLLPFQLRLGAALVLALPILAASPGRAQVETFILKQGSNVGPSTKVKPHNCVTGKDGSVTCDTKIENDPGTTPAKPQFQPFRN